MQQKGLELLVDLPPSQRTLVEIKTAIADAQSAQELVPPSHPLFSLAQRQEAHYKHSERLVN